jgi:hypothetical protein
MPAAEENPSDWYVMRGRERGGPYPYAFVHEGAKGGLISRYDLVWRPGWEEWRDAGGVSGLFADHGVDRYAELAEQGGDPGPRRATANTVRPIPPTFAFAPPAEDADEPSSNYVMAHWRGEFSLPAAFWGNGLVVGLVLVIAASAFYTIVEQTKLGTIQLVMMAIVLLVICLAGIVWLLVGVWHSASRYRSRGDVG